MKKIYAVLFLILMMLALTACSSSGEDGDAASAPRSVSAEASAAGTDDASQAAPAEESRLPEQASLPPQTQDGASKILVAYFSATNNTKGIAERISEALNSNPADLYEITPAVPYTSDDLNWHDDKSRTTIEMNDPSSRPEISGSIVDLARYDIVFVGYPIWWGEAPRILDTFVESCDFSGKTVVPFCTSGSSGVGSSAANLEKLANGGTWLSGTRFSSGTSKDEIVQWIGGLGLGVAAE